MNTIVDKIIRDMKGRKGFQQVWEGMSDEERREITVQWASYEEEAIDELQTSQDYHIEQFDLQGA